MKGTIIMKNMKDFSWKVVEPLGNFSDEHTKYTKELNVISWNGAKPIYDIRGWRTDENGSKHPLKGLSLKKEELIALRDILQALDLGV